MKPALSAELLQLLALLRWQDAAAGPPVSPFDWETFLELAHWHGVTALVWRRLSPAPDIPGEVRRRLESRALAAAARQQVLSRQLRLITGHLAQAGIAALALKGPALASRLYEDAALRQSRDLDLLVHHDDFPAACAALAELGFHLPQPLTASEPWPLFADVDEVPLSRLDGVTIDLHVRLNPAWFPGPQSLESLWRHAVTVPLDGGAVLSLDDTDLLLHTVLHGSKTLWDGLKWLCDLDRLLRRPGLDWPAIQSRAKAWNARRMLAWGLHLAHEFLDSPLSPQSAAADARLEALSQAVTTLWGQPGARDGLLRQTRHRLALSDTPLAALRGTLSLMLQPNLVDRRWLRLPARLDWVHYLSRPLRLAWKHGFSRPEQTPDAGGLRPAPARLTPGCSVAHSGLFHAAEIDGVAMLVDLAADRAFLLAPETIRLWQRLAQPTALDSLQPGPEHQFMAYLAAEGAIKVV